MVSGAHVPRHGSLKRGRRVGDRASAVVQLSENLLFPTKKIWFQIDSEGFSFYLEATLCGQNDLISLTLDGLAYDPLGRPKP